MKPACNACGVPLDDAVDVALGLCESCSYRDFCPLAASDRPVHDTIADSDGDDGA